MIIRQPVRQICNDLCRSPFALHQRRHISAYGYTQAKALVYANHGPPDEKLKLHTYSIPPAYGDSITIRYLASPINPADINQIQGTYQALPPFSQTLGTAKPSAVPGNEGVAEVISVGSKVSNLKTGDWVIPRTTGLGTWRTHDQLPGEKVLKVDGSGLGAEQVATVNVNPCTAWRMLEGFVHLKEGDWWIQNGANSAVGRIAIQLGKLWGLRSINIIRNRKGEALTKLKDELHGLGATEIITEEEMEQSGFRSRVQELTSSALPRLALNCAGGKNGTKILTTLDKGGVHVTYGNMSKMPLRVSAGQLIFSDVQLRGFWVSQWAEENPEAKQKMVEDLLEMLRKGTLKTQDLEKVEWTEDSKEDDLVNAVARYEREGGKPIFMFQ